MLTSEELGTQKSTISCFIKISRRSRLQGMDAGISSWLSKLQERSFKSFRKRSRNRAWTLGSQSHKGTKSYYGEGYFLPGEEFFRGRTSSVKTRPWNHLRGCLLILKSPNSDSLRRRLQESIIALGSFKEPWKFFRMQAWRRRQSKNPKGSLEHLPMNENSQDEWLLKGSWYVYKLPNGH